MWGTWTGWGWRARKKCMEKEKVNLMRQSDDWPLPSTPTIPGLVNVKTKVIYITYTEYRPLIYIMCPRGEMGEWNWKWICEDYDLPDINQFINYIESVKLCRTFTEKFILQQVQYIFQTPKLNWIEYVLRCRWRWRKMGKLGRGHPLH